MRIWKWVGLAGIVGATAVGIAAGTATVRRKRREFIDANPDELRTALHDRLREAKEREAKAPDPQDGDPQDGDGQDGDGQDGDGQDSDAQDGDGQDGHAQGSQTG